MIEKGFVLTIRPPSSLPAGILFALLSLVIALSSATAPDGAGAGTLGPLQAGRQELLEKVDQEELQRIIYELSGAELIYIGDVPVVLYTRYALSPLKELACQYLLDEIAGYGYEPVLQPFLLNVQSPDLMAIEVSETGDTLWVGDISDGFIYRATAADEWDTYENISKPGVKICDIERDPRGWLWMACGLPGGNLGAIYRSMDGGVTWSSVFSGAEVMSFYDITMNDDEYGIAVGSYGTVAVATWGGAVWSVLDAGIFHYWNVNGSASSGEMHFWAVDAGGRLYETIDAGATWSERSLTTNMLNAIDFWDERRGVIVGNRTSFYTADSGRTWDEVPVAVELRHVAMADSLYVLAGGARGEILVSEDGGASWVDTAPLCESDNKVARVVAAGSDRFWATGVNEVRRFDRGPPLGCVSSLLTDSIMGSNISFMHEGEESPEDRIILCAHYDSYSGVATSYDCAPGADDNGTGVAAVLGAARALVGARTEKSIEFLLFDGEELGLVGSRHFVSVLGDDPPYEAVVNLDMLGYDELNDRSLVIAGRETIENAADSALGDLIIGTASDLDLDLYPYFAPGEPLSSDHRSFWQLGIPSILLIEGKQVELTPRYHSCYDVASVIDYEYLTECTKVALATVASLAGYMSGGQDTTGCVAARIDRNWPNPFSEGTTIAYYLPVTTVARLSVYDVGGREVAKPFSGVETDGWHEFEWNGRDDAGNRLASGIYFLRLESGAGDDVRKIVVLR